MRNKNLIKIADTSFNIPDILLGQHSGILTWVTNITDWGVIAPIDTTGDSNVIRTHNNLVRQRTLKHLAKLA